MDGSGTTDQVDRMAVSPDVSATGATQTHGVDPLIVTQRLQREKRWFGQADQVRDLMMRETKEAILDKAERQVWGYSELDRLYPPIFNKDDPSPPDTGLINQNLTMSGSDTGIAERR